MVLTVAQTAWFVVFPAAEHAHELAPKPARYDCEIVTRTSTLKTGQTTLSLTGTMVVP